MRRRAQREQGYALLIVLFIGAVMAIMLYMALPRQAFEAQRAKEDVLMYRGRQYARAIRLYYRKNKKYPARLEDLEKTNNIRFLRKRYDDPITKKDEWRFIHIGGMGVFTDSLVYDKPKKKEGDATAAGTDPSTQQQITGMADRLRGNAGAPPDPNAPPGAMQAGMQPPGAPGQPMYFNTGQPGVQPGQPGFQQGVVQQQPGVYPAGGVPGNAAYTYPQQDSSGHEFPTTPFPAQQAQQGFPTGFANPMGAQQQYPGMQPGIGQQPQRPSSIGTPQAGSAAAQIIQQLLTTPRPGGLNGLPAGVGGGFAGGAVGGQQPGGFGGQQPSAFGANQPGSAFGNAPGSPGGAFSLTGQPGAAGAQGFGQGIAGVASKSEARGIKVYNERETYNEWEFVYDFRRDPLVMGVAAAGGLVQPGMGQQPGAFGQQPGAFGQQPGAFGQQPSAFGQQPSAFGQQPGAFGQQPGQPAQPVTPVNPMQPGLPSSPFGGPRR